MTHETTHHDTIRNTRKGGNMLRHVTSTALLAGIAALTLHTAAPSQAGPTIIVQPGGQSAAQYLKDTSLTGVLSPTNEGGRLTWNVNISGRHYDEVVNYSGVVDRGEFSPELPELSWLDDDAELMPSFKDGFIPMTTNPDAVDYLDDAVAVIEAPLSGTSWNQWLIHRGQRPARPATPIGGVPIGSTPIGDFTPAGPANPAGPGQPTSPSHGPDFDTVITTTNFTPHIKVRNPETGEAFNRKDALNWLSNDQNWTITEAQQLLSGTMSPEDVIRAADDAAIRGTLVYLGFTDSEIKDAFNGLTATAEMSLLRDIREIVHQDMTPQQKRDAITERTIRALTEVANPELITKTFILDFPTLMEDPEHPVYDLSSDRGEIEVTLEASVEVEVSVPPFASVTVTATVSVTGPISEYAELAEAAAEMADDLAQRLAEKVEEQLEQLKELIDGLIDDFIEWIGNIDIFDFGWF